MKYDLEHLSESWSVEQMKEFLRTGPPVPNNFKGWCGWENTKKAHIELMEELIRSCPPYPEGRWSGRGIVVSVNARPGAQSSGKFLPQGYFPCAWVALQELRRHGCTLPVLFTHLGPVEFDPNLRRLVEEHGVSILDLARPDPFWPPMRILSGWESKIDAICRAPFEEVLYLDADNIPLRDPSGLFASSQFRHYGAIFWPDVPPQDRDQWLPETVWSHMGMPDMSHVRAAESGQLLINKRACWVELNLCRWINEHSDLFYHIVFGDKDTFILAWEKVAHMALTAELAGTGLLAEEVAP